MTDELSIILRTVVAIVSIFVLTKLLGKRQISELSFFEYITGITIGSLAAYICLDIEANWYLGLISLGIWVIFSIGVEFLQLKSKLARDLIDGKSSILVKDGKILEDNLAKERITVDELTEQFRKKNVFRIADVEFAVIEPNGDINVLLTAENQPLTPKHLGIQVNPLQESQTVIIDGEIMNESLATIGVSRAWLDTELDKLGIPVNNVFIGQVDAFRQLYVDLYDDQFKIPRPQVRALLLTTLKKCQADLSLFGLSTKDPKAKHMYHQCASQLQANIEQLTPLLHR